MSRYLTYLLVFFSLPLMAQDYQVDLRTWGMKDGMSDRQVNCFLKDSHGFIWLCTRNGLNCFDGYSFKVYTKEKKQVPFRYLSFMEEDADGLFWMLSSPVYNNNNLFIFDPYTKKSILWKAKTGYNQDEVFTFLSKFNDSTLFFGDYNKKYFFTWQPRQGLRKINFPVAVWQEITISDHNSFWVVDSNKMVWEIAMDGTVLNKAKIQEVAPWPSYSDLGVYKLMQGQKNTFKLLTEVHINNGNAIITDLFNHINNTGFDVGVDSIRYINGRLYTTSKKVLRDFLAEGYIDLFAHVGHVIMDKGKIWMTNTYGFAQLSVAKNKFRKYFYQDPKAFKRNSFRNLLIDNNCLYGTNEYSGVYGAPIDTNVRTRITTCQQTVGMHYAFIKTWDGTLITVVGATVYAKYKGKDTWKTTELPKEDRAPPIWKIYQVAPDSFLLGTGNGLRWLGLTKWAFTPFTQYNGYDELRKAIILDIIPDKNGSKWICANTGFYQYDPARGVMARYSPDDTGSHYLPSKEIQHFYQDAEGIYWIATANGLIRWDKVHNTHRMYTREDGLSNSNIYAVYEDHRGRLWLSSDFGIMQFNKVTGKIKTYLTDDGITDNEFNRVSHTRDSAGNIYFGSLNGVTSFNPDNFSDSDDDNKGAMLSVSSLVQFNGATNQLEDRTSDLMHTSAITLMPGDRFFNLNFSLLTFNDVIHTTYYWRIDGVDTAWNSTREPSLRVSGLPYGKRLLHIKAQGYDGRWGRNELQFEINVIKPFYLRAWFIVMCALLIVIIVACVYRWRLYNLKMENLRLDTIVKEKTFALEKTINELKLSSTQKDVLMKEIHHRVKNNLQVISTLLSLQLSKIADKEARITIEEGISRISSIALVHYHLYKGDQLTSIEVSGFTNELFSQVSSVYERAGQTVKLHNNVPITLLDIDTALPLGLMLNELMTNSFKYAYNDCTDCKMDVTLTYRGHTFTLEYCDHGPGLPDGYDVKGSEGLGMTILKSLSKQLGGDFSYDKTHSCFTIYFLDAQARRAIE